MNLEELDRAITTSPVLPYRSYQSLMAKLRTADQKFLKQGVAGHQDYLFSAFEIYQGFLKYFVVCSTGATELAEYFHYIKADPAAYALIHSVRDYFATKLDQRFRQPGKSYIGQIDVAYGFLVVTNGQRMVMPFGFVYKRIESVPQVSDVLRQFPFELYKWLSPEELLRFVSVMNSPL